MSTRGYMVVMWRDGQRIADIHPSKIRITKSIENVGYCSLIIPKVKPMDYYAIDNFITIHRGPLNPKYPMSLEFVGILRKRGESDTKDGEFTRLGLFDLKYLLGGRTVDFQALTSQALKTNYLDNMMKDVIKDNAGGGADAARQFPGFTILPDASSVASDTLEFPKQNVLNVLKDISDLAAANGTALYFDVAYKNKDALEFRTYVNQPGADTTTGGMRTMMFADFYGNIANAMLEEDYSDEYNVVQAWGAGSPGNQENPTPQEDTSRSGRSRWARREVAINAGNVDSTALVAMQKAELRKGRPRLTFTCDLLDTYLNAVYGVHWHVGDKIKVGFNGRSYTGIVKTADIDYVALTSYQKEEETISAGFVYEGTAGSGGGAIA